MGKASRKKKSQQTEPDHLALYQAGTCCRCQRRSRLATTVWCAMCHANGRRLAKSRRRRITVAQAIEMLAALEAELLASFDDEAEAA